MTLTSFPEEEFFLLASVQLFFSGVFPRFFLLARSLRAEAFESE